MTTERKYLDGAAILGLNDIQVVEVEVPEWKTWIRIRGLSGEEATDFVDTMAKVGKGDSLSRIILLTAVDADGKQLFTPAQLDALKKKSMKALLRLQEAALDVCGLSKYASETIKNG